MKMSCNGCRVLRKGCSDDCIIRPCLEWIKSPESQANATVFLAKFYGRAGLMNLISAGPDHLRPAIFRSLLYEACGRLANPVYGSTGLLMAGKWWVCQAAVENILKGVPITPFQANADDDDAAGASAAAAAAAMDSGDGGTAQAPKKLQPEKTKLMEAIANELRKVKTKGRFKRAARRAAAAAAAGDDDVVVVMKLEPELPVMASAISQSQSQSQFQSQSQVVFNLRGRRCYSRGSSNNRNVTASSDSSCHSARNNNEPNHNNNNNNNPIEIISCLHRSSSNTAEDAEDVTLELTLCSQQQTHATPSSVAAAAAAGCALFVTSNRKFETEDEQPTESSNDADDDGQDASALTCLGLSLSAA